MIRIAIVDDDKNILMQMENLIKENYESAITIETFSESMKFFNFNNKWNYDIIFLDIDMPDINGFQIAESISVLNRKTEIVFVSNLEHLVYDSLKFRPFRFIRKSMLSKDIISALSDFESERKKLQEVFLIKTKETVFSAYLSDIIYFESMGHNIYIKTSDNEKYLLDRKRDTNITIESLSKQYESKGFIRIHKSYLLNYRFIYVIKSSEITLKNTEKLTINPHKMNMIRKQFQHFIVNESEAKI